LYFKLICPPGFRIPDYKHKNTIPKINFFLPIPHPFLFLSFPSSSISLSSLLSIFHILHLFPLLPSIPVFFLLVLTSKSRHHSSFFCTLSPQVLRNFFCHTSIILPVVFEFFDSFASFLFVPFTQLYIHPSSFCSQSFRFFTGIPVPLVVFLSLLLLRVLFFFSPAFH
jgi:hypothetical protein